MVAAIGEVTAVVPTADALVEAARIAAVAGATVNVAAATADEVVAASKRKCRSTSAWPLLSP